MSVIQALKENKNKIWNSIEIHDFYKRLGGTMERRSVMLKLKETLDEDIVILCANGYASLLAFKDAAAICMK